MALKSISGTLASADVLEQVGRRIDAPGRYRALLTRAAEGLGPASATRQVFDLLLLPLLHASGCTTVVRYSDASIAAASFGVAGAASAGIAVACPWGADLWRARERSARLSPAARWWIGCNAVTLRILDVSRAYARRSIDVDMDRLLDDEHAISALEQLLTPSAAGLERLEGVVSESVRHRVDVGRSLQAGVEDALERLTSGFSRHARGKAAAARFDDALTVVYRILFLLFAEARGLVPQWHPIYRKSYTIEALRPRAESGGSPAGLWEALQAISRLAHRGCRAGTLRVVPFNGRLFAPAAAPIADTFKLDDRIAREVLLALTTRRGRDRRERIGYGDLGVEQLGAVYERVLDYTPGGERRKGSGTFYTPRPMTEYLVRRTLAPLVRGQSPERILALRVLDPAMGSGAFLVAACRYLADAYEHALVAEGTLTRGDVTAQDRAAFRRAVAQRCLYGVDVNPTAVQLARLSLWLTTLAADRPLSFLDHHLRVGDSVVGAGISDVTRQPPGRGGGRQAESLPLFDRGDLFEDLAATIGARLEVSHEPDNTAEIVRRKERTTALLSSASGPLGGWRAVADAWCGAWFWPSHVTPLEPRGWTALALALRGPHEGLPSRLQGEWKEAAAAVARTRRFFHWELEFPEVFFSSHGDASPGAGFDAVIGNPPWAAAREAAAFSRESGCYRLQGRGHANLYQLFAERFLRLVRDGGRIGMLMPGGLLADHGCAALRAFLFDRCAVDALLGFENREGLFPVHRALRFSLITATRGGRTTEIPARTGLRSAGMLEDVPDTGDPPAAVRIPLTLVRAFSGAGLALPELEQPRDREILARILSVAPSLGTADGYNVRFGRELNATDDKPRFGSTGLPVLEGKDIEPFVAHVGGARQFIEPAVAADALGARVDFRRARLGYREVASSSNRLTLIAAVIPPDVVTTHTIFCLRAGPDTPDVLHWFLCGIFNSFVANYLVRLRGGTHLPASVIQQLPVPVFAYRDERLRRIAVLARAASGDADAAARLQAVAARAYQLDEDGFAHILASFPLVHRRERDAALDAFRAERDAI